MKKSLLALSILLSTSVMADYKIIMSGSNGTIKLPESPEPKTDFVSHTFTNCGQTGRYGPSLSSCQSSYNGAEILKPDYNFNVNAGIQYWTVPSAGDYRIISSGAGSNLGGSGAIMSGTFTLSKGDVLKILVGQMPLKYLNQGEGGAGGTFVTTSSNQPLIIAGGAGGSGSGGVTTETSDKGFGSAGGSSASSGLGGQSGTNGPAGGGAGLLGNGGFDSSWTGASLSFINGGIGGEGGRIGSGDNGGDGGFGGGGGAAINSKSGPYNRSGGGGGYSGGGGGGYNGGYSNNGGGGGGSFNSGQAQSNQADANSGHGYVTIKLL